MKLEFPGLCSSLQSSSSSYVVREISKLNVICISSQGRGRYLSRQHRIARMIASVTDEGIQEEGGHVCVAKIVPWG